jgi:hypothetical protein
MATFCNKEGTKKRSCTGHPRYNQKRLVSYLLGLEVSQIRYDEETGERTRMPMPVPPIRISKEGPKKFNG